jgi:hypothetical protein
MSELNRFGTIFYTSKKASQTSSIPSEFNITLGGDGSAGGCPFSRNRSFPIKLCKLQLLNHGRNLETKEFRKER